MTMPAAERFNPASETMLTDRFPLLAELRSDSPVSFVPAIGMWAVTGYDALREVLGDAERFPSGLGYRAPQHLPPEALAAYPADAAIWKYALIGTDAELHRRLRAPLQAAFSARQVMAVEPLIAADAALLLDRLFDEGEPADLYARFVRPLPSRSIARVFGLPVDEAPTFSEWSRAFITLQIPGLPAAAYVAASEQFAAFDRYVRGIVTGDLSGIGDGVVKSLVQGSRSGQYDLTEDELVGNIANVLFAGHETTVSTLSNMFARLLADRKLWGVIAAGSADLPAIAQELLRLDTSVIGLFRYAATDTLLAGVQVPKGSTLWAAFGATNRDPAVFPMPDAFDAGRGRDPGPMTFGYGAHYCIGRALAETQVRIALATVPTVLPSLALAGPLFEVPSHFLRITPVIPVRR
jgi:hypothetical protein